ncbi:MAG: aldo/keto reductase [Flavobacteriaceae bacterium]|nr:aldo/keto reductase [Flavobacteriaceae bacterium]
MKCLRTLSGSDVSKLTFGTMQFGHGSDYQTSAKIYEKCRVSGINHFDTAFIYNGGVSEEFLGKLIAKERQDIFIATKVGYVGGAGHENLDKQLDVCRQRLKLDNIDLLYLHRFDPDVDMHRTLDWFQEQKDKGRISHIGVSNFSAWQIALAEAYLRTNDDTLSAVQPMYSLVKRQAEVEIFPACKALEIACFSYSPLGAGLLTGKYVHRSRASGRLVDDPRYARRYSLEQMHKTSAELMKISEKFGIPSATLAVAWIINGSFKTSPIISGRSVEQIIPSLNAVNVDWGLDLQQAIDKITQPPPPATDRLEEI